MRIVGGSLALILIATFAFVTVDSVVVSRNGLKLDCDCPTLPLALSI